MTLHLKTLVLSGKLMKKLTAKFGNYRVLELMHNNKYKKFSYLSGKYNLSLHVQMVILILHGNRTTLRSDHALTLEVNKPSRLHKN